MRSENGMVNGTKGTDRTATFARVGCFGCRRSLPWNAAVLCRFEDGINDLLKCVWPISAGSKAVEDYRTPRRYRDPWHPPPISCTSDGPASRAAGFSRVWCGGVAPGCSLLRLVAAIRKNLKRRL